MRLPRHFTARMASNFTLMVRQVFNRNSPVGDFLDCSLEAGQNA